MAKAQEKEDSGEKENFVDELKPGTKLMHGQYTIESFLNAGGFGITYLARDSLDRKIVIKECFPGAFCRRSRYVVQARSRAHQNELKSIVRLFVQEARSLAKLDHPNIVGVHQVFEDNDTAYMALDFVEGRDLLDVIEDPNQGLTPAQIKNILKEVLGAVGFIHDQGILHRDISPDNILINQDYHPVLIDFGAAREEATKQSRVLSALRVVKDGYSPQEFYIAGSEQSPSSDLYALAASFHHLIVGDVPPNSQARLAAIASGEKDPYEPIAGKYPDYDDNFLKALDKALAVLPKDRVQTAKEWLAMMEGVQGNVTPLNLATAAPAAAEAAAPAAAAAAAGGSSKMPILLGSAAAVALLVGVGVFMMGGGDAEVTAPVAEAPAAPAPAPATETAAAPEAPAATETAEAAAPTTTADTADLPIFLQPRPAAPAEEAASTAPEVAETPAEDTTAPAVAEAPAEPVAPVETPEVAEVAPLVEEVTPAPVPDVRPVVRPESVEIAALPEPLPEPVDTPRPDTAEPSANTEFPAQTDNRPTADADTAEVDLPATPDNVAAIGAGPEVEIAAVTPGNEIVPEITGTVEANWGVQLPFAPAGEQSNIIASAGAIAPVWVQPGLVITQVNGTPIEAIADIPDVVRAQTDTDLVSPTVAVSFDTLDPSTGTAERYSWILPVVQEVTLPDGSAFKTVFAGSDWKTSVSALGDGQNGGLKVGDVITSYIPTSEEITDRDTLFNLMEREVAAGTEQFMFAVQRDGSLWVASLNYEGQ